MYDVHRSMEGIVGGIAGAASVALLGAIQARREVAEDARIAGWLDQAAERATAAEALALRLAEALREAREAVAAREREIEALEEELEEAYDDLRSARAAA